jgi:chromosome segregation ATPase
MSDLVTELALGEAKNDILGFLHFESRSRIESLNRELHSLKLELEIERNKSVDLEISLEAKSGIFSRLEEKLDAQVSVARKLATGLSARDAELKIMKDVVSGKSADNDKLLRDLEILKKNASQKDALIATLQKQNAGALAAVASHKAALELERQQKPRQHAPLSEKGNINPTPRRSLPVPEVERKLAEAEAENFRLRRALERERAANKGIRAGVVISENPWDEN